MNDKFLEKLRKLEAMARSCANENEAMVAAEKLQKLLVAHNISLIDLERDEGIDKVCALKSASRAEQAITIFIAKLYFCGCYTVNRRRGAMIVGTETNRELAAAHIARVVKILRRAARDRSRSECGRLDRRFMRSFMYGAAVRIRERCETLIESAKSGTLDDGSGTGNCLPACLNVYEQHERLNQKFMDDKLNLRPVRSRKTYVDNAGYAGGKTAGDKVGLGREFQDKAPKMLGD